MRIRICCACSEDYSLSLENVIGKEAIICPNCGEKLPDIILSPLKQVAAGILTLKTMSLNQNLSTNIKEKSPKIRVLFLDLSPSLEIILSSTEANSRPEGLRLY